MTSLAFRADAGTGATNRSPTTWRASGSHIRDWVAAKTFKSKEGTCEQKTTGKMPATGLDVLLDPEEATVEQVELDLNDPRALSCVD